MKKKPEEKKSYTIIDHEADIGFEVYGNSLEDLFVNAANALFSMVVDAKNVPAEKGKRIDLEANGETLIVFLNDLLYMWETEGFIPKQFSIKIDNNKLSGTVIGGIFNPSKHTAKQEVKAVTYHGFSLQEKSGAYIARIILDI